MQKLLTEAGPPLANNFAFRPSPFASGFNYLLVVAAATPPRRAT
jgi:hypothetical protein